jgi:hypothetical protein
MGQTLPCSERSSKQRETRAALNSLTVPETTSTKHNGRSRNPAKSTKLTDIPPRITVWLQVRILFGRLFAPESSCSFVGTADLGLRNHRRTPTDSYASVSDSTTKRDSELPAECARLHASHMTGNEINIGRAVCHQLSREFDRPIMLCRFCRRGV